ncbi:MAG: acyltransferase family protein [Pseudomonadota bacterium]
MPTETQPQSSTPQRFVAIDRLRTAMMGIVIFGHGMLPYVTMPRRFKDPITHSAFDWIGIFLYAFAMPAFFVTAGFAGAALFAARGNQTFWRNRWRRLGVPLLVGYVLLTPLVRAAVKFSQATAATGELSAGWAVVTSLEWLRWNKLYHLWFLASLILFSGALLLVRYASLRVPAAYRQRCDRTAANLMATPAGPLALGLVAALPTSLSYAGGTGQGTDGWMQLMLFLFFAFGWWLHRHTAVLGTLRWGWSLLGAVLVWPVCVVATRTRLMDEDRADALTGIVAGIGNALIAAFGTVALLALFERYCNADSPTWDYLGRSSYWNYLVHYPIVIAAGGVLAVTALPAGLKYLAAVGLAVPTIFLTYEIQRRLSERSPSPR